MRYARAAWRILLATVARRLGLPAKLVHQLEDWASLAMYACSLDFAPASFFDPDEPVEQVAAAFATGEKHLTAPLAPART